MWCLLGSAMSAVAMIVRAAIVRDHRGAQASSSEVYACACVGVERPSLWCQQLCPALFDDDISVFDSFDQLFLIAHNSAHLRPQPRRAFSPDGLPVGRASGHRMGVPPAERESRGDPFRGEARLPPVRIRAAQAVQARVASVCKATMSDGAPRDLTQQTPQAAQARAPRQGRRCVHFPAGALRSGAPAARACVAALT